MKKIFIGSLLAIGSVAAHAALPEGATAAFTSLSGNVTDILAEVWKIVPVVVGGFALVKLFRKGANRAI